MMNDYRDLRVTNHSNLTIKMPEPLKCSRSGVCIINFEQLPVNQENHSVLTKLTRQKIPKN